jgi:hypothetical protein
LGSLRLVVVLVGLSLASSCGRTLAVVDADAAHDAAADAGSLFACTTSPPTTWSPIWETPVTDADVWLNAIATNHAGDRIGLASEVKTSGNLSLEEYDGTGASLWKVSLGALARGSLSFAVGAGGEMFVAVAGKIETSNGILAGPGDPLAEGALFKVAPDGTLAWGQQLVEATAQSVVNDFNAGLQQSAVAIDGVGNIWVAETVFVADVSQANETAGVVVVVEKHDATDGHLLLQKTFTTGQNADAGSYPTILLSVAPDGGVVFAGAVPWPIDLRGGSLVPAAPGGPGDTFVARLDATGAHMWSAMFGDRNGSQPHGLAQDAQGNVVLAGGFAGLFPFGGALLGSHGDLDVFVVRLGPDGAPSWARSFGGDGSDLSGPAFIDSTGLIRVYTYVDRLTLSDGSSLEGNGNESLLVLDADGTPRAARCFPTYVQDKIAADDVGDLFVTTAGATATGKELRLARFPAF